MNHDLLIIKKKYGEEMAHFCREHFATLLETEGLLSSLLLEHFDPNRELYNDLKENDLLSDFVQYIYSFVEEKQVFKNVDKTPEELLNSVGYDLYECKTERDIQSFKKYYAKGEELCTFRGGRLETDYVFFAVKKNVDSIKRENFEDPERQDEYGTSVISIQFDRKTNQVSIKNRYNPVVNPDSTFGNNLDNIVEGLTDAFEKVYGFKQENIQRFEIPYYVMVNGKYYKYNYEINNNYYCTKNIFIKQNKVITYEKERYILFDYYLLDMKEKKIIYLDEDIDDSFIETIGTIQKVEIEKENNNKKIIIENENAQKQEIIINHNNQMISYKNNEVKEVGGNFCYLNETLNNLSVSKLEKIKEGFLCSNLSLEEINLPNAEVIGDFFLYSNEIIKKVCLPKARMIHNYFCDKNRVLNELYLPNAKTIGNNFCTCNKALTKLCLPSVEMIGNNFCASNEILTELSLPNVKMIGKSFCECNKTLEILILPNTYYIERYFLLQNQSLKVFEAPKLRFIAYVLDDFFNKKLRLKVLVLNEKWMSNDYYPLILTYKKNLLLNEKRRKISLFIKRMEEKYQYARRR